MSVLRLPRNRALQGPQTRSQLFQKSSGIFMAYFTVSLSIYSFSLAGIVISTAEPVKDLGFCFLKGHVCLVCPEKFDGWPHGTATRLMPRCLAASLMVYFLGMRRLCHQRPSMGEKFLSCIHFSIIRRMPGSHCCLNAESDGARPR